MVQQTALWDQVKDSIKQEKRQTQQNYKQILDEQIEHKEFLAMQRNMTRTEKGMNKSQMGQLEARRNSIDEMMATSMVPGFHNEYPLQNVALSSALKKAIAEKVAMQEMQTQTETEQLS